VSEANRNERMVKHLQGISTRDFLSTLDHDQLIRALEIAQELIKQKDAEPRISLWVISNDCMNVAAFPAVEYPNAVARAHKLLDDEAKLGRGIVVQIESEYRRESEVAAMLALDV
jgi:hypothetical protein